jgi:signal transduction histidine kinase
MDESLPASPAPGWAGRLVDEGQRLAAWWRGWRASVRRPNLRARVALGLGLPVFLILASLSLVHYWRERHLLEDQARLSAVQFGHVITASLRQAMLSGKTEAWSTVLRDIGGMPAFERAQIINLDGVVVAESGTRPPDQVQSVAEPGCNACHRVSADSRPRSLVTPIPGQALRVAMPIDNEADCAVCHTDGSVHLGILLVDVPMRLLWPHIMRDLQVDLALSLLITLVLTGGVYGLLHQLIIRRVEAFRAPLALYAAGQYEARLPEGSRPDELGALALAFNRMADRLEAHAAEQQALSALRHHAIVEERERIARELHDGLAQVLGYVQTKATAVRLLLRRSQVDKAETQLAQLEEAARGLFVDVREAILGLKMTGRQDTGLATMLAEYAEHFSRLSDLPVEVDISPSVRGRLLGPEVELQLLRLVQEALTNVRKHAHASHAWVCLTNGGPTLELSVRDDGCGFDLDGDHDRRRPHFGLACMRERADVIGAALEVQSRLGHGTSISVRLPLAEH